jgi:hypothetical protein
VNALVTGGGWGGQYHDPDKWQRSWVDYAELTDELKELDRVWARKVVTLLHQRKLIT